MEGLRVQRSRRNVGCGRAPRSRKRAERIPAGIRHGGIPKRRVEVWGGGDPGGHRGLVATGTRKVTSTLTIFFHFILRFWYHVFTCNWLRPRDSARSILERAGGTFSRASRHLPPPLGSAWPHSYLSGVERYFCFSKRFSRPISCSSVNTVRLRRPFLALAPGSPVPCVSNFPRSCSSRGRCGAPGAPGSPGPAASNAEPSPEQPSGARGNLNTAACSAFNTAAGRESGEPVSLGRAPPPGDAPHCGPRECSPHLASATQHKTFLPGHKARDLHTLPRVTLLKASVTAAWEGGTSPTRASAWCSPGPSRLWDSQ